MLIEVPPWLGSSTGRSSFMSSWNRAETNVATMRVTEESRRIIVRGREREGRGKEWWGQGTSESPKVMYEAFIRGNRRKPRMGAFELHPCDSVSLVSIPDRRSDRVPSGGKHVFVRSVRMDCRSPLPVCRALIVGLTCSVGTPPGGAWDPV